MVVDVLVQIRFFDAVDIEREGAFGQAVKKSVCLDDDFRVGDI